MIFFAGDRPSTVIATISVYKHLKHAASNTVHRGTNGKLKRFQVETVAVILLKIIPTNNTLHLFLNFHFGYRSQIADTLICHNYLRAKFHKPSMVRNLVEILLHLRTELY